MRILNLCIILLSSATIWADHGVVKRSSEETGKQLIPNRPDSNLSNEHKMRTDRELRKVIHVLEDKAKFLSAFATGKIPDLTQFKADARWRGACVSGDYKYGDNGKLRGRSHGANLRSYKNDRSGKKGVDLDLSENGLWTDRISRVGRRSHVHRDLQNPVVASENDNAIIFSQRQYSTQTRIALRQIVLKDGSPALILREDSDNNVDALRLPKYCVFALNGIPLNEDADDYE